MRVACSHKDARLQIGRLCGRYSKVMRAFAHHGMAIYVYLHARTSSHGLLRHYISISGSSVFPLANRRRLTMAYSITPLPIHRVHWAANESEATGGAPAFLLAIVSSVRCSNKVWSHSSQPIYSLKSSSPAWLAHTYTPTQHHGVRGVAYLMRCFVAADKFSFLARQPASFG